VGGSTQLQYVESAKMATEACFSCHFCTLNILTKNKKATVTGVEPATFSSAN
jgi:hypothetical protein